MPTPGPQGDSPHHGSGRLAFSVDTHLLRELGALLVGRDSTALIELIKNSYDADATMVVIHGGDLASHGLISITDNGHGMTYQDFVDKFLRIAGRSKEGGPRRSPRFGRKYTGAKGIGRLSAHKLGTQLTLESTPDLAVFGRSLADEGVAAIIDWDDLENSERSMDEANEILAEGLAPGSTEPGTILTINRLHGGWTTRQLNAFLTEVRSTRPDPALFSPSPQSIMSGPLLIPEIQVADTSSSDAGFRIEMSGEFEGSEPQWPTLLAHISWVIEIDARDQSGVTYQVTPTQRTVQDSPQAEPRQFYWQRNVDGPQFVARIFIRVANATSSSRLPDLLERFSREASGIRMFYEGFRVLPYGASRNDWLGLDQASTRREQIEFLSDFADLRVRRSDVDERTYQLPNAAHFGAVFLQDRGSAGLQMVVNREGFLPGADFDQLVEIIRRGVNIGVRMRAAIGAQRRAADRLAEDQKRRSRQDNHESTPTHEPIEASGPDRQSPNERLARLLNAGRAAAAELGSRVTSDSDPSRGLEAIQSALEEASAQASAALDEQSQLRVLASLGTQVAAFVHEVNSILAQARTVRSLLDDLLEDGSIPTGSKARVQRVRRAQNEVVASLERQAVYLSDSISAEARRRRIRQPLLDRWGTALRLLSNAAARRRVALEQSIPDGLRTPPMFPAEVNVVLTNLLSNAIKAATPARSSPQTSGLVRLEAAKTSAGLYFVIENSGVAVDIKDSEKWFTPFETTTADIDAALGQGLGLGLPLTRRIVEEYGGSVRFIAPSPGMATAVEVVIPDR